MRITVLPGGPAPVDGGGGRSWALFLSSICERYFTPTSGASQKLITVVLLVNVYCRNERMRLQKT